MARATCSFGKEDDFISCLLKVSTSLMSNSGPPERHARHFDLIGVSSTRIGFMGNSVVLVLSGTIQDLDAIVAPETEETRLFYQASTKLLSQLSRVDALHQPRCDLNPWFLFSFPVLDGFLVFLSQWYRHNIIYSPGGNERMRRIFPT